MFQRSRWNDIKVEKEENSTFLDSTKISEVFWNPEKLCTVNLFSSCILAEISNYFCNMTTIWSLKRDWRSVLLHSLGKPWVLQEGHVGEGSRGSWYSQRCPPCTSRDGDWTWPGFFEDVSGIQELTETNPDEHPNSVSRSSAQKWSLCLKHRWDGSWPGLWACC